MGNALDTIYFQNIDTNKQLLTIENKIDNLEKIILRLVETIKSSKEQRENSGT